MPNTIAPRVERRSSNKPLAAGLLVCALLLAGCDKASTTEGEAKPAESSASAPAPSSATAAASSDYTSVEAPMSTIDARDPGEPKLSIPQPPGWERNTMLDSDLIRYVLANDGLTANSFRPTAVVTLEHVPGTDINPQDVLDQQREGLKSQAGVTDMDVQPANTCGLTAETVSYTLPAQGAVVAHPARVLLVAAPHGGDTWSATVTVQAVNADDPTYQADATTILDGFQMVTSGGE